MKERIQSFGRFLSGMVMPNMGAFIAWGFITALFIADGWLPNENFAKIVDPMIKYLLPILIGYTGGHMVYKQRGAVVGAIATMGVIAGADIPMFIGAMAMGPLGGYAIKKVDHALEGKIPSGFEMLVNNFASGLVGGGLALFGCWLINPMVVVLNDVLKAGVDILVNNHLLPFTSIIVEPAKVLFLNNAINHGIFTPLGTQQALETGKSIFFLIEANPGPGLGLLLAYMVFGKGVAKESSLGAIIIHFFGGIHEIYFPYVLMNPLTILSVIAGGASGVFVNVTFNSGLKGPASPGSIFAVVGMSERNSYVGVILSVIVAAVVSFLVASVILKFTKKEEQDFEAAKLDVKTMKMQSKGTITNIVFACDAGMGSSAMGATTLSKKLKQAGIDVKVKHYAIEEIPKDTQVVITHKTLVDRVQSSCPNVIVFPITNFMGGSEYDLIVEAITKM